MIKKDYLDASKTVSRRAFVGGLGAIAGLTLMRADHVFGDDLSGQSFEELFALFQSTLSTTQSEHTYMSSDAPIRQVTLTEAVQKSPHIGTLYNKYQASLIRHMYGHMLSSQGLDWMQNTINLEGRFDGAAFKIYSQDVGRASPENSQVVINGGHFMVRSNGLRENAYALGGPISYGQQVGNNKYRVEGNAYKAHGDAVDQFHSMLSDAEKLAAYQESPPHELLLQTQGAAAPYPGVRIGDVSDAAQEVAREMLNTLFAGFTAAQQSDAWSALDENGGVESLRLAMYTDYGFYEDGSRYAELSAEQRRQRGRPYIQVWRIEGPALVIHFKGHPHVHAYMNIVRDPTKIAIGSELTNIERPLGTSATQNLLTAMLKHQTKEVLAFYPDLFLGRLSPGIVSTGSIYALDPYANNIVVAEVVTEDMSSELAQSLLKQGVRPIAGKRYRVATIDYMLQRPDIFGQAENATSGFGSVRETLIDFVRDQDLSRYQV